MRTMDTLGNYKRVPVKDFPNSWNPRDEKPVTFEKMESFFKEVGDQSPFDYTTEEDNFKTYVERKSTGYLWGMWSHFILNKTNPCNVKEGYEHNVFEWFLKLEHLITNDEMFWCLLPEIWLYDSGIITRNNVDILSRYGRSELSFETKVKCMERLTVIMGKRYPEDNCMNEKYLLELYENLDDEVTVYRSFKCKQGKSIRKGIFKHNNPHSTIQEEGRGWSYSFNRTNSIFVNGMFNSEIFEPYTGLNKDEIKEHFKNKLRMSKLYLENPQNYGGYYDCLGTYRVKKKDILFITDQVGECEVVVNPDNVDLIDYRFLNVFDYISNQFCLMFLNSLNYSRSSIYNLDGFYSLVRKVVSKKIKDGFKNVKKLILDGRERSLFVSESLIDSFGEDSTIGFYEFETDTGTDGCLLSMGKDKSNLKFFPLNKNTILDIPESFKKIPILES